MFSQPIVMIDFETSGMTPDQGARITEVAALRIVDDQVVDRFVSLINCNVRIPSFISDLTGITQTMVNRAPPVAEVMPQLLAFIGNDTLAAHNASFDEKFLLAEADRLNLQPTHCGVVCSVKLSRRVLPGLDSYALGRLAASLGIRFKGTAHRAEADAEVSSALLLHIAAQLRDRYGMSTVDPKILQKINQLTAAKVGPFLQSLMQPPVTIVPKNIKRAKPSAKPSAKAQLEKQKYRHYKGGIYQLICEATQESDLSPVIVYSAPDGSIWTRPEKVFFEMIEVQGQRVQRFTPI